MHIAAKILRYDRSWLEVDDLHNVGREAARDSGLLLVPGDLEDVALALEASDVHALLDVPDVELSRQAAAGQVVPGRAEGDGVDRVAVAAEDAVARPVLDVPEADRAVEQGRSEEEGLSRVGTALSRRAPLDGLDLLLVRLEVVPRRRVGRREVPNLGRTVVGARGQEVAAGIPLDGIDLVGVAE